MNEINDYNLSIIIPAKNEAVSLKTLLSELRNQFSSAEILVVNDGSSDDTSQVCAEFDVIEVKHIYSKGNGAAIKSGARRASGDVFIFMDGDGQHTPDSVNLLLSRFAHGFDMVVGARNDDSQASFGRLAANKVYNKLAGWMVGHKIPDLTSGLRVVKASMFREFLYLLPNGFSYPTTITMAFFRAGYSVGYIPIKAKKRIGKSHINILKDGIRFLLIIFKVGTLYSPIKLFFPLSCLLFLAGVAYYLYTFLVVSRFTNMGLLLFTTSIVVFLMGLISEQVTTLMYSKK